MTRFIGVLFSVTLATAPVMAQSRIDGFEARTYKNGAGRTIPYRLFMPARYDKQKTYPLVLWLHGGGGIGNDNLGQISEDQVSGTRIWTKPENQALHPTFVLVPQSPRAWASPTDAELSSELRIALEILSSVRKEFPIDSQRIYVMGQSNGGLATWALVTRNPRLFAAAIIVCSVGAFPRQADQVVRLPIWAFQGSADLPGITATREMIAAIRKSGGNPRYTEYQGAGHDIWDRVFKEPMLVNWLFAQHT